jgi:hypothetical protein
VTDASQSLSSAADRPTNASVSLSIAIEKLSIAIERLSIAVEKLSIAIERLSIAVEAYSHSGVTRREKCPLTVQRACIFDVARDRLGVAIGARVVTPIERQEVGFSRTRPRVTRQARAA